LGVGHGDNEDYDCGCRGACPGPTPSPPGPPGPPRPPKPGKCTKAQGVFFADANLSVIPNRIMNDCCGAREMRFLMAHCAHGCPASVRGAAPHGASITSASCRALLRHKGLRCVRVPSGATSTAHGGEKWELRVESEPAAPHQRRLACGRGGFLPTRGEPPRSRDHGAGGLDRGRVEGTIST
jgi:hypothetical protein